MEVTLQPLKGDPKRSPFYRSTEQVAALLNQQHENAVARDLIFDPLEMELRGENEVMAYTDKWGDELTVSGSARMPVISRHLGTARSLKNFVLPETPDRDPDELSQEIDKAEKQYREWLHGEHNELTRIQDPETFRTSASRVLQAVANGAPYDLNNPAASLQAQPQNTAKKMDWGDAPGYVPNKEQQAKRDLLMAVVLPMLQQKSYSMDTIAGAAKCDRDYVRQISKKMCTAEEHKENLKRQDS
jgi:hypothetical protein